VKIFLSYRREDSAAITGRIYDRLVAKFGRDSVFIDVDAVPLGVDFRHHIREAVRRCQVFLAVIDKTWNALEENKQRRLENPGDFVRLELETALENDIPIIPILIGQTPMPKAGELPPSLELLAYRNAARLDLGVDFQVHMERLTRHLTILRETPPKTAPGEESLSESAIDEAQDVTAKPPLPLSGTAGDVDFALGNEGRRLTGATGGWLALIVESAGKRFGPLLFDASQDRRIIIGRHETCDLQLPDELRASRKHAMILYDCQYGWVLQDLHSANGVFLNGNRTREAGLKVGDRIRIGASEIVIDLLTP
jgi:hypothetical protein